MYKVQSVIFNRHKFSPEQAAKWLFLNNFNVKKIDGTQNFWRFRQYNPTTLRKQGYTRYASKDITPDVKFILAYKED
jgi:hypothetical protein